MTSVFLIGLPGSFGLEAKHFAIVQRCHTLLDDVAYRIGGAMQFLPGNGIRRPAVLQPKLNDDIICVTQVFTFLVVCVKIGVVHSDCLFLC